MWKMKHTHTGTGIHKNKYTITFADLRLLSKDKVNVIFSVICDYTFLKTLKMNVFRGTREYIANIANCVNSKTLFYFNDRPKVGRGERGESLSTRVPSIVIICPYVVDNHSRLTIVKTCFNDL